MNPYPMKYALFIASLFVFFLSGVAESNSSNPIKVGAQQTDLYFPLLEQKNIAVVANQTSLIGAVHLVDSLLNSGIQMTKVFSPEHGFRGTADAGELIDNAKDAKTGLNFS